MSDDDYVKLSPDQDRITFLRGQLHNLHLDLAKARKQGMTDLEPEFLQLIREVKRSIAEEERRIARRRRRPPPS